MSNLSCFIEGPLQWSATPCILSTRSTSIVCHFLCMEEILLGTCFCACLWIGWNIWYAGYMVVACYWGRCFNFVRFHYSTSDRFLIINNADKWVLGGVKTHSSQTVRRLPSMVTFLFPASPNDSHFPLIFFFWSSIRGSFTFSYVFRRDDAGMKGVHTT